MRHSALLAISIACLWTAAARSQSPAAPQQPAFRSEADLVTVDVIVRTGTDSVGGLTAADVVLRDNGVVQRIESVEATAVPVDVSLVVDVSGGDPVWWGTPRSPGDIAERLRVIVQKTAAVLRPEDRLRLLTIDTYASEVCLPMQRMERPAPTIARVATAGLSALNDSIAAAMLRAVEPGRRHLVVALTKADDTISTIDAQALGDLARRSDTVLHVVEGDSLIGNTECSVGCAFPKKRFWRPVRRRDPDGLARIASLTGGATHGPIVGGLNRDFAGTVESILAEFHHGYVLRYAPRSAAEGWHDIDVTLPAHPGYTVQARRGYVIEARPVPARPGERSAFLGACPP